jgi:hypothetical protein
MDGIERAAVVDVIAKAETGNPMVAVAKESAEPEINLAKTE